MVGSSDIFWWHVSGKHYIYTISNSFSNSFFNFITGHKKDFLFQVELTPDKYR